MKYGEISVDGARSLQLQKEVRSLLLHKDHTIFHFYHNDYFILGMVVGHEFLLSLEEILTEYGTVFVGSSR